MEFALNLAWVLLATLLFCMWLRLAPPDGHEHRTQDRRLQFVALAVLLLILLPVISVTDDLLAVQNPAETDSSVRRDHGCASAHSIFPSVAALPQPASAGVSFGFLRFAALGTLPAPLLHRPALAGIQNRPPPAA
jgi:hypothetical protein